VRTRPALHEAEAGCYEAEADNFGHEDLTSLQISACQVDYIGQTVTDVAGRTWLRGEGPRRVCDSMIMRWLLT